LAVSVLNIITGLGVGGAEASLVRLATAVQARGMRQHVVSLGEPGHYAEALEKSGVEVSSLGITSLGKLPFALARLTGIVNRWQPKVIHGWMYHGNIMAALAHRLAPGSGSRMLLWNLRASNMDEQRYGSVMRWSARLSRWPDVIVANSESGAAFHKSVGLDARRMLVIENGIDSEIFRPDGAARQEVRRELGIALDAPLLIHPARVDPMKDHATFLKAIAQVPKVTALLVGARTNRIEGPANVRALGLRRDMPRLYAAADIVVSTSAFGEGFSNAIAEGMSAGLLPIVTDVGDARRIVGDTGRVVPHGDPAALAASIRQECASQESLAAKGLKARARIVENFSVAKFVDAFTRLYQGDKQNHLPA
jgi:glycosyltransferase involved in cell wall biosynthesis